MKNVMMNTENHLSPEDNALLNEFLVETSSFDTAESTASMPAASPEALLSVLRDAKALTSSLLSREESTEQTREIISRMANVEAEVAELKSKILDFMNKA